jgi:hypothetical protein
MLSKTNKFSTLTAYHVIYYDQLLYNHINKKEKQKKKELNELLIKEGIITRITDNVKVSADYEHEYTYILSNKLGYDKINDKNTELMTEICKKIKFISESDKAILLKNPWDFANFLYIKKIFPNAKFVFIHRNPKYVISSTMRLWNTHYKKKNKFLAMYSKFYDKIYENPLTRLFFKFIYTSRIPIGVIYTTYFTKKQTEKHLTDIELLKKDEYVSIKYEDLCEKPNKEMKKILSYLDIKTDIDFSNYIKPRKLSLTKEVKFIKGFIYKTMKRYFHKFDYK